MASGYYEPTPIRRPFSVAVGKKLYQWNGYEGGDDIQRSVSVFDPLRETWNTLRSHGEIPLTYTDGAAVTVGNQIYTYGGSRSGGVCNTLHRLNTDTLEWEQIGGGKEAGEVWPSGKTGCRMVAVGGRLALFGGFTPRWEKKTKKLGGPVKKFGGPVNELHLYDTRLGGECVCGCVWGGGGGVHVHVC